MPDPLTCPSRITRVVVYARGAVVTRRVELPVGLPAEACTLHVDGITPMAEQGSIRTEVDGERKITGLQSPLVWPEAPKPASADDKALRAKSRELRRNQQRRERVRYRMQLLEGIGLENDLERTEDEDAPKPDVNQRIGACFAAGDVLHELLTKLDAELRKLDEDGRRLNLELQQLRNRPVAATSNQPARRVAVTLGAGGHLRALDISYNVQAARWWPAYSARLSNGGKNAEFAVEAFVAQNTLEDWIDAQVSLCTADMVSDLTLPELQSLRLGRAQPAKPTGFRDPPEGLDAMFAGYDAQFGSSYAPPVTVVPANYAPTDTSVFAAMPKPQAVPEVRMAAPASPPAGAAAYQVASSLDAGADYMAEEAEMDDGVSDKRRDRARGAPAKSAKSGMAFGGMAKKEMARSAEMADELGAAGGGAYAEAPAEAAPEPGPEGVADSWLDYDSLVLAENATHRRGRLGPAPVAPFARYHELRNAIEYLGAPTHAQDPLYARGMFDHRFDADGAIEIPSSGTPQRVRVLAKPAKSRMGFRCVPIEDERVFREVEIENPLEAPLIGGPVDVFMDGALLITSAISATDRGGMIRFGLGEEQRLRVARNVRAREESKGVFKGGTAMEHEVSIEAASSLPADVEVEIVDRLPVTDDKNIKVEQISATPPGAAYLQEERHSHVRGGWRWKLPVKAGGTSKIELKYRIGFDKDFEIVGGNRRG